MLLARTFHEVLFLKEYPDPIRRLIALSDIRPGNPAHPPLYPILGACMIAVFGYSTDVIAATGTVFFVLLILGSYALSRTFLSPWQSLFAVFVVSFTPILFAASRYFMTDYATAAIVVWAAFALVKCEGFQRPGWVFFFGILVGIGILTRTITFAYLLFPAVLVALSGLFRLVRNQPNDFGRGSYTGLTVNMLMALTVTVGIFGPWYYTNLEPFYDYWSNKKIGNSRGPLTNFAAPAVTPGVPEREGGAVESSGIADPSGYARAVRSVEEKLRNPPVAWVRYSIYVVNNGLFLPLAAIAFLGMVFAFCRAQFRVRGVLLLYAWVLGSWLFFSVVLRFGTPRYAVPVAPALGLFAALFVLALPGRWVRATAGGMLAFVLLFQYGNLTIHAYGEAARVELPVSLPPAEAHHFVDQGLVLYKDRIAVSDAYSNLGAPTQNNYKERLLLAMIRHERSLPVREGRYANYQKLNLRGMELHEEHFWPGDHPYRQNSLSPEEQPVRRLHLIHMGLEPAHLLSRLAETDYILYQLDAAEAALEAEYIAYFGARGFEPIESFTEPSFGWVPARINGVLARKLEGELLPVTAESVASMNLYDLHELWSSADFERLDPALQSLVSQAFETRLRAMATPFQMNDAVTFMAADVTRVDGDLYRFRLVFQVHQAMDRDWRMLFHGFVDPVNLGQLSPENQAQGYQDWNFDPQPPTSDWAAGGYVILTHQIGALPVEYQFKFGFFQDDVLFGRTATLKSMDLSAVP